VLVDFFCIGINLFGIFGQMPCDMLVVFLFMKLQLVGVVMGTLVWFFFNLLRIPRSHLKIFVILYLFFVLNSLTS